MSGVDKIQVRGLKELRAALKEVGPQFPKELSATNKAVAGLIVGPARSRLGQHSPRAGSRAAGTIRALASGTRAQVALGTAAVPWAVGHEWGSAGRYKQFPSKSADGYALYPTIQAMRSTIIEEYGKALQKLTDKAFPD